MTLQTPVACELDLIDQWPQTLAGLLSLPKHLAACVEVLKDTLANSGMWPGVAFHIQTIPTADDVQWFGNHRDRTHQLRDALTDEYVLTLPGASAAQCVVVRQTAPGTRLIVAIPDGITSPPVSPQPFMDDTSEGYADRDVFLSQLFDVLCRHPNKPINVSALIAQTHVLMWRTESAATNTTVRN